MSNFPNIQQVLEDGGERIVRLMVNALQLDGAIFTGELAKSINSKVTETKDGATLSIEMLERGDFLDKGVSGTVNITNRPFKFTDKRPPIASLQTWARVKGVNVWYLQRKIYEDGIAPRRFIQPSLDEGIKWMQSKFEEAGEKDIEAQIFQLSLKGGTNKIEVK
jgi:hypothetical protein